MEKSSWPSYTGNGLLPQISKERGTQHLTLRKLQASASTLVGKGSDLSSQILPKTRFGILMKIT